MFIYFFLSWLISFLGNLIYSETFLNFELFLLLKPVVIKTAMSLSIFYFPTKYYIIHKFFIECIHCIKKFLKFSLYFLTYKLTYFIIKTLVSKLSSFFFYILSNIHSWQIIGIVYFRFLKIFNNYRDHFKGSVCKYLVWKILFLVRIDEHSSNNK